MGPPALKTPDALPDARQRRAHRRWRRFKDLVTRQGVAVGGIGVIVAVLAIFVYLLYVVIPLFAPADMERETAIAVPGGNDAGTLLLSVEEQNRVGMRLTADGRVLFFDTPDGSVRKAVALPLPEGVSVTAHDRAGAAGGLVALGLSDGRALVFEHDYEISYPEGVKTVTAEVGFPLGRDPVTVDPEGAPLGRLAFADDDRGATLVSTTRDGRLVFTRLGKQENLLSGEVEIEVTHGTIEAGGRGPDLLALSSDQDFLYTAQPEGNLGFYDLRDPQAPRLVERFQAVSGDTRITAMRMLLGGTSLMVGDSKGGITQYFPVRDDQNRYRLESVRGFAPMPAAVTVLEMEQRRRGFLAGDAEGNVAVYHSTANNRIMSRQAGPGPVEHLALSPRADRLMVQDGGDLGWWRVDNEHPEVSWSAIWGKVWYEGYSEPDWVWQSSASSSDFEPKFSLTPLTFGTLKGALYAMLFAVPLAIMGAIYTANFMAPRLRKTVKPTIEIMEALPTVILGFLAGLWMAPYAEKHLTGVLALLVFMPFGLLLFGWLWSRLPAGARDVLPAGWRPVLMVPAVLLVGWAALSLGGPMEAAFFGGDMRQWLTNDLGIGYDQRNALVVGFAMGFAVIPTIFSIAEDAIFSVPRSLSHGSMALGATPWQTLVRVVLPTASPGIFSGLMIGLGRAVGETMIVLMATGNTPIMDINIFEGMRTLSANIAVELPESEVNSSHYRILFLAALVLFLFTFVVNTGAEIIRQRLRRKYGQL
jgi:phosphate transport system permease protein